MATPNELQATAQAQTQAFVADARAALTDAANNIKAIDSGKIDYAIPLAQNFKEPERIDRPILHSVSFVVPDEPAKITNLTEIGALEFEAMPQFTTLAPELVLPSTPSAIGAFNGVVPTISINADFPTLPAALENFTDAPPVFADRAEPAKPNIIAPDFDLTAPSIDVKSVGDVSAKFVSAYREAAPQMMTVIEQRMDSMLKKYNPEFDAQMARIESQLSKYLAGGTGLNKSVENAIYERSRDKGQAEYLRALQTADLTDAKRGFTIPSGAQISVRQQLRKDLGDNNARAAQDIAIKQAEMEQANLQFAVTQSAQIRTQMLSSAIAHEQAMVAVNGQVIDYAKEIAQLVIEAFNSELKGAELRLESYKAQAQVFETKLRLVTAKIEIYKAEVEALVALTNVDRAKVELYNSKIQALQVMASIYKTRIEAVVSKAELEKIKVDVFRVQTESYAAQVQAKSSEYQAYSAAIQGEEAKFRVFDSQANIFTKRLEGYKATIEAKTAQLNAQVKRNESITQQYSSQVSAFATVVNARAEVAKSDLENQRLAVVAYQAEATASIAEAQSRASYYASVNQVGIEQARLFTQQSLEGAKLKLAKSEGIANASLALGKAYEGAASSAMSGSISLASITTQLTT